MSSAYLASFRARAVHPDGIRIAALSVAMAVNLAVFVVATRPLPPVARAQVHAPTLGVRLIEPPEARPLPPPPPPIELQPLPQHGAALPATPPPVTVAPQVSAEGSEATPIPVPTLDPPTMHAAPTSVSTAPVEASLAYRSAPLTFPARAIRQHMHGTVLLRVLVDAQGKPVEVIVEKSSGYALLDRSAREQVLAGWRFQPASVGGRAVRAWARVPVSFALRTL